MRKLFVLVAVLGLVAGSCGGGGDAGSCEGIVDEGMAAVQDVISQVDSMSVDDLMSMTEDPEFVTDMEAKMADLDKRAQDLGCTDEELSELAKARVDDLKAETDFGQMMIESFKDSSPFE